MKTTKFLGWALCVLGAWEIAAPFLWGYAGTASLPPNIALGIAWGSLGLWLTLAATAEAITWLGWLSALGGLFLMLAPALTPGPASAALWNDLLIGFAGSVLGMWAAFRAPAATPAAEARH
jgi:hypothetical protein